MRGGKSVENRKYKAGVRRFPPQSSSGFDQRNEGRNCGIQRESGAEWQVSATSVHNDVFLHAEECYEWEADCADVNVDTLVGSNVGF